jgi:hypothetical protein
VSRRLARSSIVHRATEPHDGRRRRQRQAAGEVIGINGAPGTAIAASSGLGFATSGNNKSVTMFDLRSFKEVGRTPAAEDSSNGQTIVLALANNHQSIEPLGSFARCPEFTKLAGTDNAVYPYCAPDGKQLHFSRTPN